MPFPLIPIALTVGTLGTLYYTRDPVSQLKQGKSYRIYVNVDPRFQGAGQAQGADVTEVIRNFLNQAGFSPLVFRSRTAKAGDLVQYVYDGTWTRGESTINAPAIPGIGASFYQKLTSFI